MATGKIGNFYTVDGDTGEALSQAEASKIVDGWGVKTSGLFSEKEYCVEMLRSYSNTNPIEKLINNAVDYTKFTGVTSFVTFIGDSLKPVGLCIILIFFLTALIDLGMSERMNLETFTKFFTKLVGGYFLVTNWSVFVDLATGLGSMVSSGIQTGLASAPQGSEKATDLKDMIISGMPDSWMGRLTGLVEQKIYAFAMIFGYLLILTILLSRLMELAIRGCGMPIALGFIAEDGLRGASIRYVKKYIALVLEGPMITIVFSLGSVIIQGLSDNLGKVEAAAIIGTGAAGAGVIAMAVPIAIVIAEVGCIRGLQQLMNDMMGV